MPLRYRQRQVAVAATPGGFDEPTGYREEISRGRCAAPVQRPVREHAPAFGRPEGRSRIREGFNCRSHRRGGQGFKTGIRTVLQRGDRSGTEELRW